MATVERFEELDVWKKARQLTRRVYEVTRDGAAAKDFAFRDQVRRASMSVMLNISEGFERESGDKDFRHFLSMAKGSVGEVRAALYVGLDCGYLTQPQFDDLHGLALETVRMLSRFIGYLDSCRRG
ncbi:MAG: four helix bundle protein [Gemmataceae bacterium]